MKLTLSWLSEFVDLPTRDAGELVEVFESLGHEIDDHQILVPAFEGVIVGRVLEVMPHPNADKVRLTRVDVGAEELEIICGAWNFEAGAVVPVAVPGAVIGGDFEITRREIRGVTSNGMICSEIELGLGSEADGIMVLNDDYPNAEGNVGIPFAEVIGLPDVWFDVNVTPNRPDCLSVYGLARDLAAYFDIPLRAHGIAVAGGGPSSEIDVAIDVPDLNPRFAGREVRGITVGPSPHWMRWRLEQAGVRPISNVVDASNYAMIEFGHPTHAFDVDRLGTKIVTRLATEGERIVTLDDQERTLTATDIVVTDGTTPVAIGGVMGGADTEVNDETSTVFIEAAYWDPPSVLATSKRLGLRSEASMRHEKGIGHELPRYAADRAAGLIAAITGARVATGIVDNDPQPRPAREIEVDLDRTARLLGITLTADEATQLLRPLGFSVRPGGTRSVVVEVPSFRLDVVAPEDVAEELARAHGYDRIPSTLSLPSLPVYRNDPSEPRHLVRRILAGLGLDEVVSHALIGPDDLLRSGYDPESAELIRLANPISEQHSIMRPVMYPSMLGAMSENVRQRRMDPWLFEVGKTYVMGGSAGPRGSDTAGTGRWETWHVVIGLLGPRSPRGIDLQPAAADVAELKGLVEALHDELGAPRPSFRGETADERHPHLHPGRAGRMLAPGGDPYGSIGEVHPAVADAWGLPGRPVVAAINLPQVLSLRRSAGRIVPVPAAQPIDRDVALVVDDAVALGELMRVVRSSAGPTLVSASVFDVYRGEQIGPGRVSYAVALRFQPETAGDEKTVERAMNRLRGSVQHHLGAEIR